MTDQSDSNSSALDQIAEEIGTITEEQETDEGTSSPAREGDEFDPDEMKRSKDDYDGGW